jgi:hypothetical protein
MAGETSESARREWRDSRIGALLAGFAGVLWLTAALAGLWLAATTHATGLAAGLALAWALCWSAATLVCLGVEGGADGE